MRILTKKIHRAYPELDKFDDDVCKRYVKRAKRLQNSWKFWLILVIVVPISWALWVIVVFAISSFLDMSGAPKITGLTRDLILTVLMTGFAWVPLVAALLTRDRWLHRCIRKQLTGVQCPTCGYSLIGLSLLKDAPDPTVHCPECGHTTALKTLGLTEADIDPTLITTS
jgi:DNA-directed RNA polymerase subunit RPC12/RpoP